jgi:CheY-like chemotaxis protein
MAKIRVIVVDDSALVRSMLTEIINRQPDMECVGAAADPLVAREMIRNLNPDVITLDVEMPRMDGIDFLSKLMRLRPMPVVMVSTLTERGADVTLKALELGAIDFVAKPKIGVAVASSCWPMTSRTRCASPPKPVSIGLLRLRLALRRRRLRLALRLRQPRQPALLWQAWVDCPQKKSSSLAPPQAALKRPRKY